MKNLIQMQKKEALERMIQIGFNQNVLTEFEKEDKLNVSETDLGILYWLDGNGKDLISKWEEKTGNKVYHLIKSNTEFGLLYSALYVSPTVKEWEVDRTDLEKNVLLSYIFNFGCCNEIPTYDVWKANKSYSEYGSIGIICRNGGLVRTY